MIFKFKKFTQNYCIRADDGIWTHDLFLTKEVLYPWATLAATPERKTRLELATLTLEGLCSTNWATSACHAFLKPQSGEGRIRTSEVVRQQIYSLPHLAALEPPQEFLIFDFRLTIFKSKIINQKSKMNSDSKNTKISKTFQFSILNFQFSIYNCL